MTSHEGLSLNEALADVEREMSRLCVHRGFDVREVGSHVVNVLYFTVDSRDGKAYNRFKVWVDGVQSAGGIIE